MKTTKIKVFGITVIERTVTENHTIPKKNKEVQNTVSDYLKKYSNPVVKKRTVRTKDHGVITDYVVPRKKRRIINTKNSYNRWTAKERKYLMEHRRQKTSTIARALGRSTQSIAKERMRIHAYKYK